MQFFKRNPFGHILFVKKWIIRIIGAYSHRRYRGFNELKIEGSEIIRDLEDSNVLFISNHQTYFADVVAMFHVFNASFKGRIGFRRSFDKKGLRVKKKNILQTMTIKKPLKIDYDKESTDEIINKIAHSIEQHETFLKVIPQKELKKENELNKKREF